MKRPELLARQLGRRGLSAHAAPSLEQWQSVLETVERTYREAEQDRYLLERSLTISSNELRELYENLKRSSAAELATQRLSQERHRLLFEASPLPMWVSDPMSGDLLLSNSALSDLLAYTPQEFQSMTLQAIEEQEPTPATFADEIAPGCTRQAKSRRYRKRSGTLVELEVTSHAMMLDGKLSIMAVGVDVTGSRRMEEQLRQAQKMEAIGKLAGGIAHDFNNILAVILANAEVAIESHAESEELREIAAAALRAAELTRQLLTFSRLQPRVPTNLALNAVVTNIEKMLARVVTPNIALAAMLAPQLGTILADRSQIEQVVMNLVVNARDAMPSGGQLTIETANVELDLFEATRIGVPPGRFVTLVVHDTGCGMDARTRSRIFDPFFTTKGVGKGTGLGLSTVFGIVQQSQGAIWVDSELGQGSTFRVYFPRIDHEAPAFAADTMRIPLGGSERLLLVEDDAMLRSALKRQLGTWGYSVTEAANAGAALRVLETGPTAFNLMITDLVMPGLDGLSLAARVRTGHNSMRVLFMSGHAPAALIPSAPEVDSNFIAKPFTGFELSIAIRRALDA